MKDREEWVGEVCARIRWKPARRQVKEELEAHIGDQEKAFRAEGMEAGAAEKRAVETMGDARTVGEKLDRIHRPGWDWTAVLMTVIMIAVGSLLLVSVTKISTDRGAEYIGMHLYNLLPALILFLICYYWGFPILNRIPLIVYFGLATLMWLNKFYEMFWNPVPFHFLYIVLSSALFACVGVKYLSKHTAGFILMILIWLATFLSSSYGIMGDYQILEQFGLQAIFFLALIIKEKMSKKKKWIMAGIVLGIWGLVILLLSGYIQYNMYIRPQIKWEEIQALQIRLLGPAQQMQKGAGDFFNRLYGWEFNLLFLYLLINYGILPMFLLLLLSGAWIFKLYLIVRRIKNKTAFVLGGSCFFLFCYQILNYFIQNIVYHNSLTTSLPFLSYGRTTMLLNAALFGLFLSACRYGRIAGYSRTGNSQSSTRLSVINRIPISVQQRIGKILRFRFIEFDS